MLIVIAWGLAVGLLLLVLGMSYLGVRFFLHYSKYESLSRGAYSPKVGVVMPLRGPDPFLKRCITALTRLDYPDYQIHIVVDHKDDPAYKIVEEVLRETGSHKIVLDELADFTDTCSLRNCALRQAVNRLPADCEVYVMIDADASPYPLWLSDLVAGLQDPAVGVACGIRWYSPVDLTLANLVRHVWNAGAILQMLDQKIGWGGAIAFKREAYDKAGMHELWGKSLFDDTFATDRILASGYQLQVVPRVTMVNEESNDLKGCFTFISRQLLNIRLYHRAWPFTCAYGLLAFLWTVSSVLVLGVALVRGDHRAAAVLGGGLAIYYGAQTIQLWIAECIVHGSQLRQGKPGIAFSNWKLPFAMVIALVVYPLALLKVLRTQSVTWRGITYEFQGPLRVRRLNYQPFAQAESQKSHSL